METAAENKTNAFVLCCFVVGVFVSCFGETTTDGGRFSRIVMEITIIIEKVFAWY